MWKKSMRALLGGKQLIKPQQGQFIQRPGAQRDEHNLQQQQGAHIVPQPENGTDQGQDRLDMVGHPGGDKAVVGHLDKAPTTAIPDGLINLTQISLVRPQAQV